MDQVKFATLVRGADGVLYEISAASVRAVEEGIHAVDLPRDQVVAVRHAASTDYSSARLTIDPSDDYASSRLTIEAGDDYATSRLTIEPEVLAEGRPVFTVDPRHV
jgi:hypothetical protein